jgi:CheY-like chemotaxis protein
MSEERCWRLLIVEDNRAFVDLTRAYLASLATLVHVERAEDAAALLAQGEPFDAILLDLGLQTTQGRATFQYIFEANKMAQLPIIVVTGSELDHGTPFPGGGRVVWKPMAFPDGLIQALHDVLDNRGGPHDA